MWSCSLCLGGVEAPREQPVGSQVPHPVRKVAGCRCGRALLLWRVWEVAFGDCRPRTSLAEPHPGEAALRSGSGALPHGTPGPGPEQAVGVGADGARPGFQSWRPFSPCRLTWLRGDAVTVEWDVGESPNEVVKAPREFCSVAHVPGRILTQAIAGGGEGVRFRAAALSPSKPKTGGLSWARPPGSRSPASQGPCLGGEEHLAGQLGTSVTRTLSGRGCGLALPRTSSVTSDR